jgi:pimeloyl-ACP methyl ester carboxylesterase
MATEAEMTRSDFHVTTGDGVRIRVRELRPAAKPAAVEPLILVHGARVPGIGSFDLPVPGGSLASDLAARLGRAVYVMDARGYGGSDRAAAMDESPAASRPLSRGFEVVRDIDALAGEALRRTGASRVALLGWATGGAWTAYYASLEPERVGHLVTLNALYGGADRHAMLGARAGDAALAGYALYDAASLFPVWDKSIPLGDKAAWRDPAIAVAYAAAALASDPTAARRRPASFRAPLGAIEDSTLQAQGRRLFDASSITASVLVIRAERDFWSRPEDAEAFAHDATRARSLRVVTLPDATHHVHLDRPERGRDRLLAEVAAEFLAGGQ